MTADAFWMSASNLRHQMSQCYWPVLWRWSHRREHLLLQKRLPLSPLVLTPVPLCPERRQLLSLPRPPHSHLASPPLRSVVIRVNEARTMGNVRDCFALKTSAARSFLLYRSKLQPLFLETRIKDINSCQGNATRVSLHCKLHPV